MNVRNAFLAILVSVVWGSNFVAAKYSIAYFPPFYLTALRFAAVALLLIPFVPVPTRAQMRRIIPIAVLSALQFSLFFVALSMGLDISTSAIVGQLGAFLVAVTTSVFWSAVNILIKYLKDVKPMALLAWMSLFSVPILLALSFMLEPVWPALAGAPPEAIAGLAYTVVASTIVAYGLWYYLLSRCDVSQVTPYSLLTPVFAILCGHLFFAEEMTAKILIGGALTIAGVGIIVIRRPKLAEKGEVI